MPITQLCKFPSLTKTALLADYVERLQIIADKESQLCLLTDQGFCPQCVLNQVNRLFARWPDPTHRPSLFGVPIGVKDIFRVDGYVIRVGSLLPGRLFCAEEARLVTLLKNLGAVVLAITASTEFAHAAPSVARNPHNIHYTPGGSSSGSAAGVAAGFFPLALGTQTMGSIVRPAAFCGVCGWKAPIGAWSKVGIIPFAPSIDEPGLFAQSTEDIAYAVDCFPSVFPYPQKITLKKWRLGVVSGSYLGLADPDMRAMFSHLVNEFAARCPEIELEEIDLFPDWNKIENVHRDWAYKELSLVHENWFARFQPLFGRRHWRPSREESRSEQMPSGEALRCERLFAAAWRVCMRKGNCMVFWLPLPWAKRRSVLHIRAIRS